VVRRALERAARSPYGLLLLAGALLALIAGAVDGLPWPLFAASTVLSVILVGVGGAGVGLTDQAEADRKLRAAEEQAAHLRHDADLIRARMLMPYNRMRSFYGALADMQVDLVTHWQGLRERNPSTKVDWAPVDKALTVLSTDINHFVRDYEAAHEEWRDLLPDELAKLEEAALPPRSAEIDRS